MLSCEGQAHDVAGLAGLFRGAVDHDDGDDGGGEGHWRWWLWWLWWQSCLLR